MDAASCKWHEACSSKHGRRPSPEPFDSTPLMRRTNTVKNFNRSAAVAVFALLFSGFAFSQAVFNVVNVPGSVPDSLIAINNTSQVVVNGGSGGSSQISVWSRVGGGQSIALSGHNNLATAINSSGEVAGAGLAGDSSTLQAFD